MLIYFYIIILNISFSNQLYGVFHLIFNNFYLQYFKRKLLISNFPKHPNSFFRIIICDNYSNNFYYNIEEIYTKYKLSYLENNDLLFTKKKYNASNLWKFIKTNNNKYIIQNKNNCSIIIKSSYIICDNINLNEASEITLFKIYEEVILDNQRDNELLEKEPIDIIIKYIDLKDPNLHRKGIHQIEKDVDNEELRYSIRSILKNIPWVRKIFIIMPNEKVRYFKEYKLIKEKIIYVKDKDLIGFDSSNSLAFQFRYWKMKDFGISDNFIVMDDDYFIGKRINKSDFFYVENGRVVPSIITTHFIQIERENVEMNYQFYKYKAKNSKEEQNNDIFNYSRYLTYLFILNIFNISKHYPIYIPKFTHNAIPCNFKEIKEIYDFIYMSEYKSTTLNSLYRHIETLQFQTLLLSYIFIKYKRRIRDIKYKFIKINESISGDYNFQLFCINKGPGNYSNFTYLKAKIAMEYLFPVQTPYEIIDYSFKNISFKIVYSMNKLLIDYEHELQLIKKKVEVNYFTAIIILIILLIFFKIYSYFKFQFY